MAAPEPPPPPIDDTAVVRVEPYTKPAAGMGSIVSAMATSLRQMGGFRTLETLSRINQKSGFDCPGCAWPDPDERGAAEFCENGAKHVASEATTRRVTPEFFARHSVADMRGRGEAWLEQQGRLTEPMYLAPGETHYHPIAWDDAFRLIAARLNALASPDEAVFYASGRTSNEAAFLYQLFVRQYGTNNLPDCSHLCHESSGVAMTRAIGVGKGTVSLEDFELADCILIIGQNPGTNHPRMMATLQAAARRGCTIISINPLREASLLRFSHPKEVSGLLGAGTAISNVFLQVRVNGDVALLKGLMKAMLEMERAAPGTVFDHDFIQRHTADFDACMADLAAESWPEIVEQSGIAETKIREAATLYASKQRAIACWAMGLTQHKNAVGNIQSIVNLLLLRGHLGRPGAGLCPVRGHSNVQGDRTMGITEKPKPELLDALANTFHFDPPRQPGHTVVSAIAAMREGRIRVFFALGGNFLMAAPDTPVTADALAKCDLTVHVSTKLNGSHLATGKEAMILPCLGRTELDAQAHGLQFVTVEDSMRNVRPSRGSLAPASEHLRSEPAIVAGLAKAVLGNRGGVDWDAMAGDYGRIRDAIAAVIPGFENFNTRLRESGEFVLPNPASALRFDTPGGKARFTMHAIPRHAQRPGELLMMSIRSHDQYNTTIYSPHDRYRGIYDSRQVVLVNHQDIEALDLRERQRVTVTGSHGGTERSVRNFTVVGFDIPRGCCAMYFPEANPLVPFDSYAEGSHTPTSKSIVVRLVAE